MAIARLGGISNDGDATMRQFQTQNGRRWTAATAKASDSTPVLRFRSADGLTFEMRDWPDDWESLSDDALAGLLKQAFMQSAHQSLINTSAIY